MNTGYQVRGLSFQVYYFSSALSSVLSYFLGALASWRFKLAVSSCRFFFTAFLSVFHLWKSVAQVPLSAFGFSKLAIVVSGAYPD